MNDDDPLPSGKQLKIAILYSDAQEEYFFTKEHYLTEKEVEKRASIIAKYLQKIGHQPFLIPGNDQLVHHIKNLECDMAINMVDSVYGQEYLCSSIPGMLEILRIPYTGSGILGQSINTNKYLTKTLLSQYGITTPKYQLISALDEEVDNKLDYPLIVKLNEIHGSVGITDDSICYSESEVKRKIKELFTTYHQPILIEEFIAGSEISIIVVEGGVTKIYAAEKIFPSNTDKSKQILTYEANWMEENNIQYKKYKLPYQVKDAIKTMYSVLKMEDYAKFDIRLDLSGRHYVIDANTNPALSPSDSSIGSILQLYDISFSEFLNRLIKNTMKLYRNDNHS